MKTSRIREMSIEVTVGAFLFMVLLALGVFTIILSGGNLFRKSYDYTVQFEEVLGIREGDNVFVRGVSIGKVKRIDFKPDCILMTLRLQQRLHLRKDYRVEILPSSVLGGRYLYIYEGSRDAPDIALADNEPMTGLRPVDLIDSATRTVQDIRDSIVNNGVLTNLEATMENLNTISDRLSKGEGSIGKLLVFEDVYNDLKEIASNLKEVSGRLNNTNNSLVRLMSDNEKLYSEVDAVVENLRKATQNVADGKGTLGKLLSEDDTLYKDISQVAEDLKDITATIRRGEGTVGKVIKDEQLYNDLRLAINELRATLSDYRETSPITTFTSVFFGAF